MPGIGEALAQAAESFNAATLPRINLVADEATRTARQLQDVAAGLQANPQSLIFGAGRTLPGPGERGFVSPEAGAAP